MVALMSDNHSEDGSGEAVGEDVVATAAEMPAIDPETQAADDDEHVDQDTLLEMPAVAFDVDDGDDTDVGAADGDVDLDVDTDPGMPALDPDVAAGRGAGDATREIDTADEAPED
jgi:hypothetical protein